MNVKSSILLLLVTIFSGCAVYAGLNYDQLFGTEQVRERQSPLPSKQAQYFLNEVKPILDNRCVVCHACYDAPCQLKLTSVEGIDRGATDALVYQGTRLTATTPTRLYEDAFSTQEWRAADFHPVLNERDQTEQANLEAGVMARLLMQKERHPLPQQDQLEGFDFSIDREQTCPTSNEIDHYEQTNPNWGMPFGMPNLSPTEYATLIAWLKDGAIMNQHQPLTAQEQTQVAEYEAMLNHSDLKNQLSARYIYEHLYLSHLYFSEIAVERPRFFKLIRSSTPPGQPIKPIATRRPYEDPGVKRVYYRLTPELETIVDKTHMPFALNQQRIANWKLWFIDADYQVAELPSYQPHIAANPMSAFIDLPVKARFKFLLDNAQNTVMAFIKGPVCRGQLALNVINDRFWVFFLDPDKSDLPEVNEFYRSQVNNLKLPAERENIDLPLSNWVRYSLQQTRYLEAKSAFLNQWFKNGSHLTTDIIWDGSGSNPNAALTIFRHFDNASVVQGLVGEQPKTVWVLDYALLERIHYLLVAGFDVYGNFGHQLVTRMFMDFLRMEGESNFIALLPRDMRHQELSSWYQNQSPQFSEFLQRNVKPFDQPTSVQYVTDDPKSELLTKLRKQVQPVLSNRYAITDTGFKAEHEFALRQIDHLRGEGLLPIPQLMMLMIESERGEHQLFTLIHNNAHTNISSLFDEKQNRDPKNDTLTLVRGVVGSYPAVYLKLKENQIPELYQRLADMKSEPDYVALLDRFAVRRSSPEFWPFSDQVHQWYRQDQHIEFGLLDYNRYENR